MENMQLILFVSRRIRGIQSLSLSLSLVPSVYAVDIRKHMDAILMPCVLKYVPGTIHQNRLGPL